MSLIRIGSRFATTFKTMKWLLFSLILFLLLLLEGTITTLPLVLIFLLCFAVVYKKFEVFLAAFVAGILLDIMTFHTVGASSLFFIVFLTFVFLYERKFEIQTIPFIAIAGFSGSALYTFLFGYNFVLLQGVVSAVLAMVLFFLVQTLSKLKNKI